jgi:hypothetical protein
MVRRTDISWLQVGALASLQGAITLCWLVYNLYVPQLLTVIGFDTSFAVGLLVVENLIAVVIEPLMGCLSDNAKHWFVSRFYFVSIGVILSSALFIFIPTIITLVPLTDVTRWLFLFVVVCWSLTMSIFRSPATALLGKYTSKSNLPLAGSLLTLASGIIGAFRPISTNFILGLGAIFAFAIGAFVLLGAAYILRYVNTNDESTETEISISLAVLFPLLGSGIGVACGSRLLMDILSKLLKFELGRGNVDGMMFIIGLALAFAALPAGALATKIGNRKAMIYATYFISVLMLLMLFSGANFILILLTVFTFSIIINGAVPLALSLVTPQQSGLAVGTYFSGSALGTSLISVVFSQLTQLPLILEVFIGVVVFIITGACVKRARINTLNKPYQVM